MKKFIYLLALIIPLSAQEAKDDPFHASVGKETEKEVKEESTGKKVVRTLQDMEWRKFEAAHRRAHSKRGEHHSARESMGDKRKEIVKKHKVRQLVRLVVVGGLKLGELLLEADVLNKRQLQKALAMQASGDKRQIGEILIELKYITLEDLTDIMMENGHSPQPTPVISTTEPIDISQDAVMKTKFALDVKTIIAAATGIASLVGMWYMLQADIQEAKELPKIGNIYNQEYPSKPEGYNWPRSYEQYKDNVEDLQNSMDDVLDLLDEYEAKIEDLEKTVTELRVQVANKRDK